MRGGITTSALDFTIVLAQTTRWIGGRANVVETGKWLPSLPYADF